MLYNYECHFHVDFNVLYKHSAHGFRIIFTYNYPFSKPFQNVNIEEKYIFFFHFQIYTKISTSINKTSHLTNVFFNIFQEIENVYEPIVQIKKNLLVIER